MITLRRIPRWITRIHFLEDMLINRERLARRKIAKKFSDLDLSIKPTFAVISKVILDQDLMLENLHVREVSRITSAYGPNTTKP